MKKISIHRPLLPTAILLLALPLFCLGQKNAEIRFVHDFETVHPLDTLTMACNTRGLLSVRDGGGRVYVKCKAAPEVTFLVGGSLGTQTVTLTDAKNNTPPPKKISTQQAGKECVSYRRCLD